jgi:hypothetical protein
LVGRRRRTWDETHNECWFNARWNRANINVRAGPKGDTGKVTYQTLAWPVCGLVKLVIRGNLKANVTDRRSRGHQYLGL